MKNQMGNWWDNAAIWTRKIMDDHYARRLDDVMDWIADDVMWIGPTHNEYVYGKKNVERILEKEQDIVCEIAEASYDIIWGCNEACATAGRLNPRTEEDSDLVLSVIQRVTFVFALREGLPKIVHMHVSNDWDGAEEDETFPYRAGREAFLYLQKKIAQNGDVKKLAVRDAFHNWHCIAENEILYIAADHTHSIIHTIHSSITVPYKMSEYAEKLSDQFIRAHRSYIVNPDYVIGIKRFSVHLYNGAKLPIPQKKYTRVKRLILSRACGLSYLY